MKTGRLIALALAATPLAALAGPVAVAPAATGFRVGELQLYALRDMLNVLPNDNKVLGVGQTPDAVAAVLAAAGAPTDVITLGVDALLVKMPGHVVLLDTGLGPKVGGVLTASLAKAGVTPAMVTDVLITHSHGDHIGGLVTATGAPAFPRATIRMSQAEWRWMQRSGGPASIVAAVRAQVKPFAPGTAVLPGIVPVALPGHTPGHVGYRISSGGQTLFDIGDTAHSAIVSLAEPQWPIAYDSDEAEGEANRVRVLAELAKTHERIFAPHFPYPGVGHVVTKGGGYAFVPDVEGR